MAEGRILRRIALLLVLLFASTAADADERRLALVIGNGAYAHAPPLANPPRDARAVAQSFRRLGFEVIEAIDLGRAGLVGALRDFGRRADGVELAIVYFAGHGIQVKGQNYVLPIDAQLQREQDLRYEAISIQAVLDEAGGARRLRLVILDACRDNPFVARLQREMGATRSTSVGRGLKIIEEIAPDTLVAYATSADSIAEDGKGQHSPYTQALLEHLETPGLELNLLFGRVRDTVMRRTNNRQQPFTYGSLGGDPVLLKAAPVVAAPPPPAPAPASVPAAPPASNDSSFELAFWDSIKQSTSAGDYQAYLEAYPNGRFAPLARARLAAYASTRTAAAPAAAPPAAAPPSVPPPAPREEPPPAKPRVAETPPADPPPLPSSKPAPPRLALAAPPPPPPSRPAPAAPPPAPVQEARAPAAPVPPAAPENRACPRPGTRISLSTGDVLTFGNDAGFLCALAAAGPSRQVLGFITGPDPRSIQWQGKPPALPLAPGARFAFISEGMGDGGYSSWYHDFRVVKAERVSVRAGTFDTLVLREQRTGWNGNQYEAEFLHYVAPELGFVVKHVVVNEYTSMTSHRMSPHNRGGPAYGPIGRASWEAVAIAAP